MDDKKLNIKAQQNSKFKKNMGLCSIITAIAAISTTEIQAGSSLMFKGVDVHALSLTGNMPEHFVHDNSIPLMVNGEQKDVQLHFETYSPDPQITLNIMNPNNPGDPNSEAFWAYSNETSYQNTPLPLMSVVSGMLQLQNAPAGADVTSIKFSDSAVPSWVYSLNFGGVSVGSGPATVNLEETHIPGVEEPVQSVGFSNDGKLVVIGENSSTAAYDLVLSATPSERGQVLKTLMDAMPLEDDVSYERTGGVQSFKFKV